MCALHIHTLETHKYRIHAQEHQFTHTGVPGTWVHTLHFHAHTHLQTTVCPNELPSPRSASTLSSVLPVPAPPSPVPSLFPVTGQLPGWEDLPRGLYSLFFVPLLFPSLAFWAGGAKGEMNGQLTERRRIPGKGKHKQVVEMHNTQGPEGQAARMAPRL